MRDLTPFINRTITATSHRKEDTYDTKLEIDDELSAVLNNICQLTGLSSHEEALTWLVKRRINGTIRDAFIGRKQPPVLSVIKGGKE